MDQPQKFPPIPLIWVSTDVPDLPFELPVHVLARVEGQNLIFTTRRAPASSQNPYDFVLHRSAIQEMGVRIGADLSPREINSVDLNGVASVALFRHSDPLQVVPYFQSRFISPKSYWIKALMKLVGDEFNSHIVNIGQADEHKEHSAKYSRRTSKGFVRNLRRIFSMG